MAKDLLAPDEEIMAERKLDNFIQEFGDNPSDYTIEEKGEMYGLYILALENTRKFLEKICGPSSPVLELFSSTLPLLYIYTNIRGALFDDLNILEDDYFSEHIYVFRTSQNYLLSRINDIRIAMGLRNHRKITPGNTDSIYIKGSRLWFVSKIFFDLCNDLLDKIEKKFPK